MDQRGSIIAPPCHIGGDDVKALSTGPGTLSELGKH